jgi:hypothetical protein
MEPTRRFSNEEIAVDTEEGVVDLNKEVSSWEIIVWVAA